MGHRCRPSILDLDTSRLAKWAAYTEPALSQESASDRRGSLPPSLGEIPTEKGEKALISAEECAVNCPCHVLNRTPFTRLLGLCRLLWLWPAGQVDGAADATFAPAVFPAEHEGRWRRL